jgi:D-sedoheptulose 7-phosphate isomerase
MKEIDPAVFARRYATEVAQVLSRLRVDDVAAALDILAGAHAAGTQVFLIGNGGSAATASHWANDLTWGLMRVGIKPIRAVALTDNVPLITAIANDSSYDEIFARQLEALAVAGDTLVAISGSGNSKNIVAAVELAKAKGLKTVGILGMSGGRVAELVDVRIVVDSTDYGPIEDVHMVLDHLALGYLRAKLQK